MRLCPIFTVPNRHGGARVARRRRAVAFTMIEVMLAITIFAGVVAAIYSCWSSVMRGSRIGLSAAASAQRGRVASRALEDALSTATMFQDNVSNYSFVAEMNGDFTTVEFTAHLPESFPGFGIFDGLPVRRIRFSVDTGTNGSPQLVMTQMPYLLTTTPDQEPYAIVLAKRVSVFALHFWDTNANDWADDWLQYTNQVPRLIRYEMAFDDQGDKGTVPAIVSGVVTPAAVAVPASVFAQTGGRPNPNPNPRPQPNNPNNPNGNPNGAPNNSINNFNNTGTQNGNRFIRPNTGFGGNNPFGGQNSGGIGFGNSPSSPTINNFNNSGDSIGGFIDNNAQIGSSGGGGRSSANRITQGTIPVTTGANSGVAGRSGISGTSPAPGSTNGGVSSTSGIVNATNPPGIAR